MVEGASGTGEDELVYHVDGELVAASEATVNVRDRGFTYGDAAFETLRVYGGEPFEWEAHADRLAGTCEAIGLDHGIADDDLRDRIDATLVANDLADAYVRLSITRGVQPGKLTPRSAVEPTVVVIVAPLPRGGPGGESVWDGPARATIAETRRIPTTALPARTKTHNYLNGILARLECRETDADEAIMLDGADALTEGATSNIFFVGDGVLRTPSLEGPVLPGVTRAIVLELAESAGIAIEEGTYAVEELLDADEGFLTNTTWELRPIASVDGTVIGCGPVTDRLRRAFDERVAAHYEPVE
ncbi:aminotransferase class IV [Halalkalicoccus ordinarius]|uniref:aminotransferase class IV n=1 Tax=Halalkalicoccus ordinarius TaxID=3116651 RepID=UPI00300E9740